MATKNASDPKATKAMNALVKAVGKQVEKDDRSAMGRLCSAVLLHFTNATTTRKALAALELNFCDWNDVRISEKRDVIAVLTGADVKEAWHVAEAIRLVLQDIYQQYNVCNFDHGRLSKEIFARPDPIDGEEVDVPTIRENGLPQHESIHGFLDGSRLLSETSLLDPALIVKKNDDRTFMSVFDNPTRVTAKIVWAVGIEIGILDKNLLPFEALPRLRSLFRQNQIEFVSLALMYYERNARSIDKLFKFQREPEDLMIDKTPFSVQLGFTDEDDHQGGFEPLMPRSEGIGRNSKRATAKLPGRKKAVSSKKGAKPKGTQAKAKAEEAKPAAKKATKKSDKKVVKKATKKVAKKAVKKTAKKATKKAAKKVAKKTTKKAAKKAAKKTVKKTAKKATKKVAKKATKKTAKKAAKKRGK